jgi:hypothetical protein
MLHQDTPYSAATSEIARAERDAACSSRGRSRPVSRHRGCTRADRSVNTRCEHRGSAHRYRRLRQISSRRRCPNGRSFYPRLPQIVRSAAGQHLTPRTGVLIGDLHDHTRRTPVSSSSHDTTRNPGRSNNNDVPSLTGGLLRDRLRQRSAWEATPPSAGYDTQPLTIHRGEPVRLQFGANSEPAPEGLVDCALRWIRYSAITHASAGCSAPQDSSLVSGHQHPC